MTPDRLRELVAGGETLDVEFKGERREALSDHDLVSAVVCLSNRASDEPGWLLIGVEDDGAITGARPRGSAEGIDPLQVQALIASRTRPSVSCRVEVVETGSRQVIAVEVASSRVPIARSDGTYSRRAIGGRGRPECLPFFFHEMQARHADRGLLDYMTVRIEGLGWDALDPLEFERFRRTIREARGLADQELATLPDVELAKALGAVEANHEVTAIRVLALLLFGREEALRQHLPVHEVAFQGFSGSNIVVNDFFRWPLLRITEELLSRFRAWNTEQELMVGMLRLGVPDYSERAFREAVANALVHRDYTRLGAVHVQWRDESLEISNPGSFPEGVRLDNLLVTPPRPRNLLLADAFKRAGIVERTARGIDAIFYEQLRNGRPPPSYARSTETDVVLVLPGGPASLEFVRLAAEEQVAGRRLNVDDLLLLNCLWQERRLTTRTASALIQKPEAEARAVLQHLVEAGLVEGRGARGGRTYYLSASTYRRLGDAAAYVRLQGFEPLQQEQMVLQYVRSHGRIARRQVAELCRLSSGQARNLLARLVAAGSLRMEGTKRGAFYISASKNMDASKSLLDASKNMDASKSRTGPQ